MYYCVKIITKCIPKIENIELNCQYRNQMVLVYKKTYEKITIYN